MSLEVSNLSTDPVDLAPMQALPVAWYARACASWPSKGSFCTCAGPNQRECHCWWCRWTLCPWLGGARLSDSWKGPGSAALRGPGSRLWGRPAQRLLKGSQLSGSEGAPAWGHVGLPADAWVHGSALSKHAPLAISAALL